MWTEARILWAPSAWSWTYALKEPEIRKALGGNHDEFFLNWLDGKEHRLLPYANNRTGGLQTVTSFWPEFAAQQDKAQARSAILHHYAKEITFLRTLPDWLEDDRHIYAHAGIDGGIKFGARLNALLIDVSGIFTSASLPSVDQRCKCQLRGKLKALK